MELQAEQGWIRGERSRSVVEREWKRRSLIRPRILEMSRPACVQPDSARWIRKARIGDGEGTKEGEAGRFPPLQLGASGPLSRPNTPASSAGGAPVRLKESV